MPRPRKKRPGRRAEAPPEGTTNPFFVGGGFVRYCVEQGWLELEGSGRAARYLVTPRGRRALAFFGIKA